MSRGQPKPAGTNAKTSASIRKADPRRPAKKPKHASAKAPRSLRAAVVPQLREYDRAWEAFQGAVVEGFAQSDPLLSRVPVVSRPYAAISRMTHGGMLIDEPAQETESIFEFQVQDIRSSNLEVFTERLFEMATRFIETMARQLYASMDRITTATGQVVNGEGRLAWDALIDGIERMPPSFDSQGQFNANIFVNPETLSRLPPPTQKQRERLEAVQAQKKREYDSTRRSRRLPSGS